MATTATRSRAGNPDAHAPVPIYRSPSVSTITTSTAHGLNVGNLFTLSGMTDTTFNGTWVVNSVPDTTTLTFLQSGDDVASGGDVGGTVSTAITAKRTASTEVYNSAVTGTTTVGPIYLTKGQKAYFSVGGTFSATFAVETATSKTSGAFVATAVNGATTFTAPIAMNIYAEVDMYVQVRCTAYTSGTAVVELKKV